MWNISYKLLYNLPKTKPEYFFQPKSRGGILFDFHTFRLDVLKFQTAHLELWKVKFRCLVHNDVFPRGFEGTFINNEDIVSVIRSARCTLTDSLHIRLHQNSVSRVTPTRIHKRLDRRKLVVVPIDSGYINVLDVSPKCADNSGPVIKRSLLNSDKILICRYSVEKNCWNFCAMRMLTFI